MLVRGLGAWTLGALLSFVSGAAAAHAERTSFFPQNRYPGANPSAARQFTLPQQQPKYRPLLPTPASPRLVVCKKPGNEGVGSGEDSAARIGRMAAGALKTVNQQLLAECAFEHLQAAVDAVTTRGTTIYVLPGIYLEQPSVRALDNCAGATNCATDKAFCEAWFISGRAFLSYEEQFRCRHIQNTVAIFGDPNLADDANPGCGPDTEGVCANPETQACDPATSNCKYYDLQIEGTGPNVYDVIFEGSFIDKPGDPSDGHFKYLNGIRADRADGIYLRNFTTQIFEFNSVYVEETDGFVFDKLLSRYVDEYSFLSFASDHGLYNETGGYGVADSVQYPGSGADIYKNAQHSNADLRTRAGTEIRNSWAHHASLGYSGTAGNSPWVHDNVFYKMQTGMATESIYGGHPGMPQDHGLYENNLVFNNNKNYTRFVNDNGPCIVKSPRDAGLVPPEYREFDGLPPEVQEAVLDRMVVCPAIPFPPGTAFLIGGGNYDITQNNIVFDNWRQGLMLFHAPAALRSQWVSAALSQNVPRLVEGPIDTDPANPFDNSHFNRYLANHFAENTLTTPHRLQPNGVDFWFDNSGVGNCWRDNTSFAAGGVSTDTGNPVQSLPSDCPDGPAPNTAQQVAAENPLRIAFLAPCINYNRNDPSSKDGCSFFDPLFAPAGRQGETTVIVSRPPQAVAQAGQTVKTGYFVLNNDTGETHNVNAVTVAATGALAQLSELKLSATIITDTGPVTRTATASQVAGSNVFTFAEPVLIEPVTYVLFELEATAATQTAAAQRDASLLLASGAGSAVFGVLLLAGGMRRRYLLAAAIGVVTLSLLTSCGGGGGGDDDVVGGGGGGGSAQSVAFSLTGMNVTNGATAVTYGGLPANMGSVTIP